MTVKLTLAQIDALRKIRTGRVNSSPPLRWAIVKALLDKGFIEEFRILGAVKYRETEKGKQFP